MKDFQLYNKELKPNDIILIKVDPDKISLDKARLIFDDMQEQFSNHQAILVLDGITLDFVDWQRLYDFVLSIKPEGENVDGR